MVFVSAAASPDITTFIMGNTVSGANEAIENSRRLIEECRKLRKKQIELYQQVARLHAHITSITQEIKQKNSSA